MTYLRSTKPGGASLSTGMPAQGRRRLSGLVGLQGGRAAPVRATPGADHVTGSNNVVQEQHAAGAQLVRRQTSAVQLACASVPLYPAKYSTRSHFRSPDVLGR